MKKLFAYILLVIIFLLLFFFFHTTQQSVTINNHTFIVEIARTPREQETGLAKYTTFAQNRAMYFSFGKADYYAFWMKDMHFPIDILFLRNAKIITIYSSVPAPTTNQTNLPIYRPVSPADGVLEINAGLSQRYGFKTGDSIKFSVE